MYRAHAAGVEPVQAKGSPRARGPRTRRRVCAQTYGTVAVLTLTVYTQFNTKSSSTLLSCLARVRTALQGHRRVVWRPPNGLCILEHRGSINLFMTYYVFPSWLSEHEVAVATEYEQNCAAVQHTLAAAHNRLLLRGVAQHAQAQRRVGLFQQVALCRCDARVYQHRNLDRLLGVKYRLGRVPSEGRWLSALKHPCVPVLAQGGSAPEPGRGFDKEAPSRRCSKLARLAATSITRTLTRSGKAFTGLPFQYLRACVKALGRVQKKLACTSVCIRLAPLF